jgi:hypothetical protein
MDDLAKTLGILLGLLATGTSAVIAAFLRTRKELISIKGQESKVKRETTQDETDSSSLKLLLESAGQWKKQYEASVARETRMRRLLAVSDAKMRRFVQQAAEDRAEDRRKIEALTAQLAETERKVAHLESLLGGRRATDERD